MVLWSLFFREVRYVVNNNFSKDSMLEVTCVVEERKREYRREIGSVGVRAGRSGVYY